jgi:hypothetical protein
MPSVAVDNRFLGAIRRRTASIGRKADIFETFRSLADFRKKSGFLDACVGGKGSVSRRFRLLGEFFQNIYMGVFRDFLRCSKRKSHFRRKLRDFSSGLFSVFFPIRRIFPFSSGQAGIRID